MPKLVIKGGPGVGRDFMLGAGACVVGRDPGVDFTLEDNVVSRRHFRVVQEQGAYWVEDLGSTNGTLVNGRRMERIQLVDGDVISVGGTQVAFVQKDLLAAAGGTAPAKPGLNAPVSRRQRKRGAETQRSQKPAKPAVAPRAVTPKKPAKPAKPARPAKPPAQPSEPPEKGGIQAPVPRRRRGR